MASLILEHIDLLNQEIENSLQCQQICGGYKNAAELIDYHSKQIKSIIDEFLNRRFPHVGKLSDDFMSSDKHFKINEEKGEYVLTDLGKAEAKKHIFKKLKSHF